MKISQVYNLWREYKRNYVKQSTLSAYTSLANSHILLPVLKNFKKIMKDEYFVASGTDFCCEPRLLRNRYYEVMREKIKLSRIIHFHGLRHSFATRLISTGTDPKTTSILLGHSKVEMTMNLYVHPTQENKNSAVNKSMNSLFKK